MATAVEVASGYVSVYASIESSEVRKAVDAALRGITGSFNVKADARQAASVLSGLSGMADAAGNAITATGVAVTAAAAKFGSWALETMSDAETVKLALTNMTGSAELARDTIRQLQDLAVISPYNFKTLETAGQRLVALGFAAKDVTPTLQAVGDAVAATGGNDANLTHIIHDLGQMKSQGRVTSRVMMNLANNSIASWQMLADHLGVSVDEARDMVKRGVVSADEGVTAILSGMTVRYGGMMEQASKTVSGILSNMVDSVQNNIMGLSGTSGYGALRDSLARLVEPLDGLFEALTPTFSGIMSAAAGWVDRLTGLVRSLYHQEESAAGGAFTSVLSGASGFRTLLRLVGSTVALGPGLKAFSGYLSGAGKAIDGMGTAMGVLQGVGDAGMKRLGEVLSGDAVKDAAKSWLAQQPVFKAAIGHLWNKGLLSPLIVGNKELGALLVAESPLTKLMNRASKAFSAIGGYVKGALGAFSGFANVATVLAAVGVAIAAFGAVALGTFVAAGGSVSDLASTFATDLGNVGGFLTSAIDAFAAALPALSEQLATAMPTVLAAVRQLVADVVASLMASGPALLDAVTQIAVGIGAMVVQNAPTILGAAMQMFGGFLTAMAQTVAELAPQLPTLVQQLAQAIVDNAPAILDGATQLFTSLVTAFATVAPAVIAQIPTLVLALGTELVTHLPDILSAAATLFMAIAQAVPQVLEAVLGALASLATSAAGVVSGAAGQMQTAALAFVGGLLSGAQQKGADVLAWFRDLPGNIVRALGDVGSTLWSAGSSIINGFLSGLRSAWSGVTDFVGGIAGWIAANKGPLPYDARLLIPHGMAIMRGLGAGLEGGFDRYVTGLVSDMSSQIASGLATARPQRRAAWGTRAGGVASPVGTTVNQTFNTRVVRGDEDLYSASSIIHRNAIREAGLV